MKFKNLGVAVLLTTISFLFLQCKEEKYIYEEGNLVPKTVVDDPTLPSAIINGAKLHTEAFGHPDSTIVVCIHGGPGSDYRYMLNCKDLVNQGYRVVFYDQIGTGLSQRFPKNHYEKLGAGALDMVYDELQGIINHYKKRPNQKVYLLGHSWGGMLATGFVGKYPTAVQGLVAMEAGGLQWDDIVTYVTNSQSFKLWSETLNDATYIDQFLSDKEDEHAILDYKLTLLSSENDITAEYNSAAAGLWRNGAVVNSAMFEMGQKYKSDLSIGVKNFNPKVLFFYSELNKAYPLSWAEKVTSAYKNVEIFKVNGVGHSDIVSDKKAWKEITMPKIVAYFKAL